MFISRYQYAEFCGSFYHDFAKVFKNSSRFKNNFVGPSK